MSETLHDMLFLQSFHVLPVILGVSEELAAHSPKGAAG